MGEQVQPDPRSGLDERGEWTPAFEGQRPPFEPGHELSVRHGAYSELRLGKRVDELVPDLREQVVGYRSSDEVMVRLLAVSLARAEAHAAALEAASEPSVLKELDVQLHRWVNRAAALCVQLGMSSMARGRLGVDVAVARRVASLTSMAADQGREEGKR